MLVNKMKTIDQIVCVWQSDMQVVSSCTMRMKPPEWKQTNSTVEPTTNGVDNMVCGSGWNIDSSLTESGSNANGQDSSKGVSDTSEPANVQKEYRLTYRKLSIFGIVQLSSETFECAESGNIMPKSQTVVKKHVRRNDATRVELRMNSQTLVKLALLLAILTKVIIFMH